MKSALFAAVISLAAASTASADVRVTMQNGRVSIVAKDATVRQILTEWARVGQTKIINVERIPGGPLTLELNDVPEANALEVLLRSLSGYIAAPRPANAQDSTNLSQFDRIIIMPTVAAARPAPSSAPPPVYSPQQTVYSAPPAVGDDEPDDQRPAPPNMPQAPNRGPVFNTFPQPQVVNPQTAGAPTAFPGQQPPTGVPQQQQGAQPPATFGATPTAPYGGVAVPGMVAPPPPGAQQPGQQPGQVQPMQPGQVQPTQPGQPVRRPGGQN